MRIDDLRELGLPSGTTDRSVIKKAYFQLAKLWHPDRPGGSTENFQRLINAYERLEKNNYPSQGSSSAPSSSYTQRPRVQVKVLSVLQLIALVLRSNSTWVTRRASALVLK